MRRVFLVAPVVIVGACSFSSSLTGPKLGTSSGPSATSGAASATSSRQIAMPDLLGKTPEEARKILSAAGFDIVRFEPATQNYTCDFDRRSSYELFTICYQRPAPGYVTSNQLHAEYQISRSLPGRGEIGTPYEYVIMPEVRGKPLAEAKKILTDAGLAFEKHFDVEVAGPHDRCEPEVVCQTSPSAMMRKQLTSRGTIVVGPKAAPKPVPPPPTTPPAQPNQPNQPSVPSGSDGYF